MVLDVLAELDGAAVVIKLGMAPGTDDQESMVLEYQLAWWQGPAGFHSSGGAFLCRTELQLCKKMVFLLVVCFLICNFVPR